MGTSYFEFDETDALPKGQCSHREPGDVRRDRVSLAKLVDDEPANESAGGLLTMALATKTTA